MTRTLPDLGANARLLLLTVLVGTGAGLFVHWGTNSPKVSLTIVMAVITVVPVVVRVAQRQFNPFEPIMILVASIFAMFVVRPVSELLAGPGNFLDFGFNAEPGYVGAMTVCLVGTISLYLGYFSRSGLHLAHRLKPLPASWDTAKSVRFVVGLIILTAMMTAVFAATLGGFGALYRFYLGRTETDNLAIVQTAAYFALAPYMLIPGLLIVWVAFKRRPTFAVGLLLLGVFAAVVFTTVPRGDRTYVLAWAMPLLVMRYLRRDRIPSLPTVVAGLLVAIIAVNVMIALRQVSTRAERGVQETAIAAVTDPLEEIERFVTGVDIAEFTIMEVQWQAHRDGGLAFEPGTVATSVLTGPVPRRIMGDSKPDPPTVHLADWMFPDRTRKTTFVPSIFGDLYGDWGFPTVIFYSFLLGLGTRCLWEYYRRNKYAEGMQIILAASLPMLVILMRNNLSDAGGRALFLIAPLILCLWACGRNTGRRTTAG